jgi:uncharacterized protein
VALVLALSLAAPVAVVAAMLVLAMPGCSPRVVSHADHAPPSDSALPPETLRGSQQGESEAQARVAAGSFEDGVAAYKRGDYATALRLWRPLADQGDATAQYNLGVMYGKGQGVPQDDAEAVKWYRKAADQGLAAAQYTLGVMYGKGQGVPQAYVQAYKWFTLAAARFPAAETESRNAASAARDLAASKMTPAQIAEALRLAREWEPK